MCAYVCACEGVGKLCFLVCVGVGVVVRVTCGSCFFAAAKCGKKLNDRKHANRTSDAEGCVRRVARATQ